MISVEPQVFTIRGGYEHGKFGDPYSFVVTAIKDTQDTIRLIGLVGKVTMSDVRDIRKYFNSIGIKSATWERSDDV